jgi:Carboxypeptidase regulatory-like domain
MRTLNSRVQTLLFASALLAIFLLNSGPGLAQSLGNAGTIQGTVLDPTGASVPGVDVTLLNRISGYSQTTKTDSSGAFRLSNIPPNPYHLEVKASGFQVYSQDVDVKGSIPVTITAKLALAGSATTVTVEAAGADLLELDPSAHVDVDRSLINKIPITDPASGLSDAITYSTGGVAADANGFFHPLGDHAQVSFVIDGQPISDQQSKVFSTQLPISAVQSMELITGAPESEFGDKSSLVAQITTRSGLGATRMFGNVDASYGSFGTVVGSIGLGFGNEKMGNFLAVDGVRSGRFLDTPEFAVFHDIGNNQSFFDRFDFQPTPTDVFHLNLFAARNWIQIPVSYDQLGQDQRQRVLTWSVAPGYQHTFSSHTLFTVNPYIRKDQFNYYPSDQDTPFTASQNRHLLNWGVKSDISTVRGRHNLKIGLDLKQTRLLEEFGFGITDFGFNAVCLDADGSPAGPATLIDPARCASLGFSANPNLQPGLVPYDLTRGGNPFGFRGAKNINQYAFYVQDGITLGNFLLNVGLRGDVYDGIVSDSGAEPRVGVAYNVKKTGTVLRAAYSRTFETPFNENLILSSAAGVGGLAQNVFGALGVAPIHPGRRNQYNVGLQQAIGRWLLIDGDYFWKYTDNAYDFSILLNTTITFPISWKKSKLDGVTGRVSTINMRGFQAYWTFGHTRARYFPPEVGGLLGTPLPSVFRIDHDQAFQSNVNFRYQRPKNAEWVSLTWRYDSGLVVSGVKDVDAATLLSAAQQVTIGFSCDGKFATFDNPITDCRGVGKSKLLTLPQTGTEDDDHNPDRVRPRHVFNLGLGTDNLYHREGPRRIVASLEITNLTNRVALYNFLSTFSGTHFLQPRSVVAHVGFVF